MFHTTVERHRTRPFSACMTGRQSYAERYRAVCSQTGTQDCYLFCVASVVDHRGARRQCPRLMHLMMNGGLLPAYSRRLIRPGTYRGRRLFSSGSSVVRERTVLDMAVPDVRCRRQRYVLCIT